MAPSLLSISRPQNADELIQRMKKPGLDGREKAALDALVEYMVTEFRDYPNPSYYIESSRLSEITDATQYEDLMKTLTNTVIESSHKGYVLDRDLLPAFDHCLRQHRDRSSESFLSSALGDLGQWLTHAIKRADSQSQYFILHVLGTALDVAMDIHHEGIDRETIHKPLHDTLCGLKDNEDSRIAQAATYAYEALRGIPDNEGPMDVFFRTSGTVISATAKIAGGVAGMDPDKALSAVPDILEIVGYFGKLLESLQNLKEGTEELKNAFVEDIRRLPKQGAWYSVLRFTGPLISSDVMALDVLKDAIPELPCRDNWRFWCGLYDQLEQRWMDGDRVVKDRIIEFVEWSFNQESLKAIRFKKKRIQDWIDSISETFGRPQWKEPASIPRRDKFRSLLRQDKSQTYSLQRPFQHGRSNSLTGRLFDTAWKNCQEAHRLYMDAGIAQNYEKNDLLAILRLSGQRLEMRNCYINLSLIETTLGRESGPQVLSMDLRKRLQIEAPSEGREIQLQSLYKERKLRNGVTGIPKRILIRGRAGVGKTTLCKKIIHEFIHDQLPSWDFERVLWIPLRKLKRKDDPEGALCEELSPRNHDKDVLASCLRKTINVPDPRTLFLLDGFDEIAGEVGNNDNLRALLNQDNVIITSRPHALDPYTLRAFDLELETVGFRPDQVQEYVSHIYLNQPELASEIKKFMQGNWLIGGLLQIPIQLDALCYTWEESHFSDKLSFQSVRTMTALYQAMEVKLWRKDMKRLRKCEDNEAKSFWDRPQIEAKMYSEIDLLEKLAFNGLVNNLVEFSPDHRKTLYRTLPNKAAENDNTIESLSFLRASSEDESKTHYFIHLTFQEYFAACYFVRCWRDQEPLQSVSLESAHLSLVDPESFLRHERYNGRYDILWRFVSGLLSDRGERDNLVDFIKAMDSDPKDLFGPAHLNMLMHCFSEVSLSKDDGILRDIEQDTLKRFLELFLVSCEFENVFGFDFSMVVEFPESPLKDIIEKGSTRQKIMALNVLSKHAQITPSTFQQVAALAMSGSEDLEGNLGRVLGHHWSVSPETVVEILKSRVPNDKTKRLIGHSLHSKANLPDTILHAVISEFLHSPSMYGEGRNILKNQKSLSREILDRMVPLLQHEDPSVVGNAVSSLSSHLLADETVFHGICNLRDHGDDGVRSGVADALIYAFDCPEALQVLDDLLKDDSFTVRMYAAISLEKQRALPPGIVDSLHSAIEDSNDFVKRRALSAWSKHCPSAELVTERLFLASGDESTRGMAGRCLQRLSSLPEHIESSLLSKMQSGTLPQQYGAAFCFKGRSNLDGQTLQALLSVLSFTDETDLQDMIIEIFGNQSTFPDVAVKLCGSVLLAGKDHRLHYHVLETLDQGHIQSLPEEILKLAVPIMKDGGNNPFYARGILRKQRSLSDEIIQRVVSLLNEDLRWERKLYLERILREHVNFFSLLPNFNRETWTILVQIWFFASLSENLSCYRSGDLFILNMPQHTYKIPMSTESQRETVDYALMKLQEWISSLRARGEGREDPNSSNESQEDEVSISSTRMKEEQRSTSSAISTDIQGPDSLAESEENEDAPPRAMKSDEDPDSRVFYVRLGTKWAAYGLLFYAFCHLAFVGFLA